MGEQLRLIVSRDGYQLAGDTIMKYEWSSIDALRTREEWIEMRSDAFNVVDGYGITYPESPKTLYTDKKLDLLWNSWCEYLYIITPENMIEVHKIYVSDKVGSDNLVTQVDSLRANVPMEFFQRV
jgi:hypothetical protein